MNKGQVLLLTILLILMLFGCEKEELDSPNFLDFISPTEYELRTTNYYAGDTKQLIFKYASKHPISKLVFSFIRVNRENGELNVYDSLTVYVDTQQKSGTVTLTWNIPIDPTPENHAERIYIETFYKAELLSKRVQILKPILPKD